MPELASVEPDAPAPRWRTAGRSLFAGTAVVGGRGEGIVVATGVATELGRIARGLAQTERRRSPLQRELDRLVRILLVVAVGLIVVTVGLGFMRGNPVGANLLAGISAAIAAIPEEPPVLLAVILGLGSYRLLRARRPGSPPERGGDPRSGRPHHHRQDRHADGEPARAARDPDSTRAGPTRDGIAERRWPPPCAPRRTPGSSRPARQPGSFTRALLEAADELGGVERPEPSEPSIGGRASRRPALFVTWSRSPEGGADEGLAIGAPEAILALRWCRMPTADGWRRIVDREASGGARLLLLARADRARPAGRPIAVLAFADPLRPGVEAALRTATGPASRRWSSPATTSPPRTSIARGPASAAARS